MSTSEKVCRNCGRSINPAKGRVDRVYCDERCKNQYHNARGAEEYAEVKRVERVLRKNHRILKSMFRRKDRDAVARERLLRAGFDFDYHTHHVTSKVKGYLYVFCYGYGYRPVEGGNHYKVVKGFETREHD